MADLVCEFVVTIDGWATATDSLAYYGYGGPEFADWLAAQDAKPHRTLLGRKTYEVLSAVPEPDRDESYRQMVNTPGWVFSTTLRTVDWPGLEIVNDDVSDRVRSWKADGGPEIRTAGSLSIVRELMSAGLVDRLRLMMFPVVLPRTGAERIFNGYPDMAVELLDTTILDGRVLVLDYRPDGPAPKANR